MVDFPTYNPNQGGGFVNALMEGARAGYFTQRAKREADLDRRADDAQQYIQPALQGDQSAFLKLATANPQAGNAVATMLGRLDAQKKAQVKDAADFATQAGMGVLNAPPDQQPAAYASAIAEANRRGIDTSNWPQQWGPAAAGFVQYNVNKARPVNEYFQSLDNRPQPMAGGAPAAMPSGGPAVIPQGDMPKAKQMVQYLQGKYGMSPVAASGVVGGLYQESGFNPNAVGDNGTAAGMAQWRGDRQQALAQFAQSQGRSAGDPQTQLDFLVNEMKSGDMGAQRAYAMLQQAKTPQDATTAMMYYFRPAGFTNDNPTAGHGYAQRLGYAQSVLGGPIPNATPGEATVQRGPYVPGSAQPQLATNGAVAPNAFGQGDSVPPTGQLGNGPTQDPNDPRLQGGVPMGIKGVPVLKDGMQLFQMPDKSLQWYKPQPPAERAQAPQGYRWGAAGKDGRPTLEAIPGGPADLTRKMQSGMPAELANTHGDDFRGSDFWQAQPPEMRNIVEGLIDGSIPVSTLPKRGTGGTNMMSAMALAKQIDPNWSPNAGEQGKRFATSLVGDGKNAQNVLAINTVPLHAEDLVRLTDAINQNNPKAVQGIINRLKDQFGDTAVPDMNAAKNVAALEFLKAAVGTGNLNVTLEKEFMNSIDTARTAGQMRSVVAGYVDKVMGRANVLMDTADQYNLPNHGNIIHKRTQDAIDFLKGPGPNAQSNGQPQPSLYDRVVGMFGGGNSAPAASGNQPSAPSSGGVRRYNPATGKLE